MLPALAGATTCFEAHTAQDGNDCDDPHENLLPEGIGTHDAGRLAVRGVTLREARDLTRLAGLARSVRDEFSAIADAVKLIDCARPCVRNGGADPIGLIQHRNRAYGLIEAAA